MSFARKMVSMRMMKMPMHVKQVNMMMPAYSVAGYIK